MDEEEEEEEEVVEEEGRCLHTIENKCIRTGAGSPGITYRRGDKTPARGSLRNLDNRRGSLSALDFRHAAEVSQVGRMAARHLY